MVMHLNDVMKRKSNLNLSKINLNFSFLHLDHTLLFSLFSMTPLGNAKNVVLYLDPKVNGKCKYARECTRIGDCKNARECTRDNILGMRPL